VYYIVYYTDLVKLLCSKIVNYIALKKGATRFVRIF